MRGYACLMSDFRAHRYNVLVLQQRSYGPPTGTHTGSIDRFCARRRISLLTAEFHQPNALTGKWMELRREIFFLKSRLLRLSRLYRL
jgi:hypothetical protein